MPSPPLTHHEILGLVGPFARAGRQVDLGATQRQERRIVFRPLDHPAVDGLPALRESLLLESFGTGTGTGTCRLTRSLTRLDDGLRATVQVLGADPELLHEQVQSVPASRQFRHDPGFSIARSYQLTASAAALPSVEVVLERAEVRLDGLRLGMSLSPVKGVAAELLLEPTTGEHWDLPQDLLTVLGWNWARMVESREGWRSKLRLRGGAARRTAGAEGALDLAASHLAATLAEPPARFHQRWRAARWQVALRRALPLLTVLGSMIAAPLLPREPILRKPGLVTLLFQVPIALIALSFAVQEMAQFEIPPLPRRSTADSWRKPTARQ